MVLVKNHKKCVCVLKLRQKTPDIGLINDYVTLVYDIMWWVSYAIKVTPDNISLEMSFLPPGPNPSILFPNLPNVLTIDFSDVVTFFNPVKTSGRTYILTNRAS